MGNTVKVEVVMTVNGTKISATKENVRLNGDALQIAAAGLAHGLVEEAWSHVPDEDED